MRPLRLLLLALAMLAVALPGARALAPDEVLDDPVLEQRARELSAELRCMVCQNQSIDDSDAPLAKDLRVLVRERLVAGDTNAEVVDFLVARYGEFVLLKPRLTLQTVALWGLAPLALAIGLLVLFLGARRRRGGAAVAAGGATRLTGEEQAELDRILSRDREA